MLTDTDKTKELALKLLAQREHSQLELRRKLQMRHIDPSLIDTVLQELASKGLQSDDRFTEIYTESRMNRGFGPNRIQQELMKLGITDEIIEKYMANQDKTGWTDRAKKAYYKRFGENPSDDFKERLKQKNFLYQRGFTQEQIHTILK